MKKLKNLNVILVTLGICTTPILAHATNGLFMIGFGNKSRAMGGVGIAMPLDSLSAAANPATISGMDTRFDIGMDIFMPNVESQLGSVSSESVAQVNGFNAESVFILPSMGGVYQLNDKYTLGVNVVPVGGGGTKFRTNFFEAAGAGTADTPGITNILGVDLLFGEIVTTIAYKANENHHFGASFVIGIARFEAYGLNLFDPFTQTQGTLDNFTNQGKDWTFGFGGKIGWLGNFGDLSVGASYSSKVYMDEYNNYGELLAENGDMDIPANFGLGIAYKFMPEFTVAFDVTRTFYEDVRSIANTGPNLAGDPAGPLGSDDRKLGLPNGLGFGWTNMTVYKLGGAYQINNFILRAGWNYGENPINEDREIIFNLLAPAVTEHHLTLGGTYLLGSDMEINLSYIHAFAVEISGPTYISDDGSNLGRTEMDQNAIGGSFSMKF